MDLHEEALSRFAEEFKAAALCGLKEPTAVTVATASAAGRPSVRTVLLKSFDRHGFVFYTNLQSHKGREISENPKVALCFYWGPLAQQVIVEGDASLVSDAEADAYWSSRERESQIGGWASLQSRPLADRAEFLARIAKFETEYASRPVPRPPHWTGVRVAASRIEFWKGMAHRLHERTLYEKSGQVWTKILLYP